MIDWTAIARSLLFVCATLTATATGAGSQTAGPPAAPAGEKFEVVSIKRNVTGDPGGTQQAAPGRFVATNVSSRMLIASAYGV